MSERRKHERYSADHQAGFKTNLMFRYELLDDTIADGVQIHREGPSTILNISKGGCYIHCHAPFPPETRLLITMTPPAFPNEKIIITGMIVRKTSDGGDGYYFGVEFIEHHENSKAMLYKFIKRWVGLEDEKPIVSIRKQA